MAKPTGDFVDQLGAASIEAKEVLAELRSELKEARRVRRELEEAAEKVVQSLIDEAVRDRLGPEIDRMATQVQQHVHITKETVTQTINEAVNTCVFGNKQGHGVNIFEALRDKADEWVSRDMAIQAINRERKHDGG